MKANQLDCLFWPVYRNFKIILASFAMGYACILVLAIIQSITYWSSSGSKHRQADGSLPNFLPSPSIFYILTSKTPFFFTWQPLMKGFEEGFLAACLISVLATLGCFCSFRLIWDERISLPAVVAVGLYAASYRFSGAWMDIAKQIRFYSWSCSALPGTQISGLVGVPKLAGRFVPAYLPNS
jgi:hypothetical protein